MRHTHYYRVSAKTHFELGFKLALLFKKDAQETYLDTLKKVPSNSPFLLKSKEYLTITREAFPEYIEQLEGYAKGIEVEFNSFWVTFLDEELDIYPEKCTSSFSTDGMIVGHNEDFYEYFNEKIALVEITLKGKTTFELYYYNSLGGTACGINQDGYVQTINDLHHANVQVGVPRNIIARWFSQTNNPRKDFEKMKTIKRSMGYSHTFNDLKGSVVNIESTEKDARYNKVKLPYVHTNHYLSDLSQFERITGFSNTRDRFCEATRLVKNVQSSQDMMRLLEQVSSLNTNNKRETITIARLVFDMKKKEAWCWLSRESSKGWIRYPLTFL